MFISRCRFECGCKIKASLPLLEIANQAAVTENGLPAEPMAVLSGLKNKALAWQRKAAFFSVLFACVTHFTLIFNCVRELPRWRVVG